MRHLWFAATHALFRARHLAGLIFMIGGIAGVLIGGYSPRTLVAEMKVAVRIERYRSTCIVVNAGRLSPDQYARDTADHEKSIPAKCRALKSACRGCEP